jgi:hypothetical protein
LSVEARLTRSAKRRDLRRSAPHGGFPFLLLQTAVPTSALKSGAPRRGEFAVTRSVWKPPCTGSPKPRRLRLGNGIRRLEVAGAARACQTADRATPCHSRPGCSATPDWRLDVGQEAVGRGLPLTSHFVISHIDRPMALFAGLRAQPRANLRQSRQPAFELGA